MVLREATVGPLLGTTRVSAGGHAPPGRWGCPGPRETIWVNTVLLALAHLGGGGQHLHPAVGQGARPGHRGQVLLARIR